MRTILSIIVVAVLMGALALVTLLLIGNVMGDVEKDNLEREKLVGEYIVLKNDTIQVKAFNAWGSSYTFDDGTELSVKTVEGLEVISQ